jgi:hypothetical protein
MGRLRVFRVFILLSLVLLNFQNCTNQFQARDFSKRESISEASRDLQLVRSSGNRIDRDHYLRRSCYCLDCHDKSGSSVDQQDMTIGAIAQTGCQYIRWASFPWVSLQGGTIFDQSTQKLRTRTPEEEKAIQKDELDRFEEMVKRLPPQVIAEYGIPEILSETFALSLEVSASELAILNELALKYNPSAFPFDGFSYSKMVRSDNPNNFWGGTYVNGMPILDSKAGWHYHLLLFIRAHSRGARGFYLSQANHRFSGGTPAGKEFYLESLIMALRSYAVELTGVDIIFGSESLEPIYSRYQTVPPNAGLIDFVKYIGDLDVAEKDPVSGDFFAMHQDGTPRKCRNSDLLSMNSQTVRQNSKGQRVGPLCLLDDDSTGGRAYASTINGAASLPLDSNIGNWPVMLEFDGCSECHVLGRAELGSNAVYYKNHGDDSTTDCYSRVRNGLSNTMLFISQPKSVREQFNLYASYMAIGMSSKRGHPIYFPQGIKVDQNHFWQLPSNYYQLTSQQLQEQKNRVRLCPATEDGAGKAFNSSLYYSAILCDDLGGVKTALSDSFINEAKNGIFMGKKVGPISPPAPPLCVPNSTTMSGCSQPTNGQSIKTCNSTGTAYGACTISCNAGFELKNSQCVALPPPALRIDFFSILSSDKSKTMSNSDFIENLYRALLGRASDSGGFSFWKGELDAKVRTREAVRIGILGTDEFVNILFKNDNRSWVKNLYKAVLRRESDLDGENFWVKSLNDKTRSRSAVLNDFLALSEYTDITKKD